MEELNFQQNQLYLGGCGTSRIAAISFPLLDEYVNKWWWCFYWFKIAEYTGSNALALKALCSKISYGGSLKESSSPDVCLSVCLCSRIFASGARMAGPIGTGEAPFDASKRQKDDGWKGVIWHISLAGRYQVDYSMLGVIWDVARDLNLWHFAAERLVRWWRQRHI